MKPVIVVGGGVAGLNCAGFLAAAGQDVLLLEAGDGLGGRVATQVVDGCTLDIGFQVFQTAYPEARAVLDYEALDLVPLEPGAAIRKGGKWHRMSDPIRRPSQALATAFNPIGGFADRLRLLKLRRDVARGSVDTELNREDDESTRDFLTQSRGFSASFVDGFLRPWLAGIFLEEDLKTSSNYFQFVFRMLSSADISYPRQGIQAIPDQLASRLSPEQIRLSTPVAQVQQDCVTLATGEEIAASKVVLAVDANSASRLTGSESCKRRTNGTTCIYFVAQRPPSAERSLMLNGDGVGPVNHVFIPTNTVPELASEDRAIVSVSLVGKQAGDWDEEAVRTQMKDWFGESVDSWRVLKVFEIPEALPEQLPGFYRSSESTADVNGMVLCGDYLETSSLNGAMRSGRLAAERIVSELKA